MIMGRVQKSPASGGPTTVRPVRVWKSRSSRDFGAQIQILVAYAVRRDLLAKSSDMGQSQNNITDWRQKGYDD